MTTEESSPSLLTAKQVGLRINRSPDTVRRMWDNGALPYTRMNGRRMTPAAALEQWLAALSVAAMDNVKDETQ